LTDFEALILHPGGRLRPSGTGLRSSGAQHSLVRGGLSVASSTISWAHTSGHFMNLAPGHWSIGSMVHWFSGMVQVTNGLFDLSFRTSSPEGPRQGSSHGDRRSQNLIVSLLGSRWSIELARVNRVVKPHHTAGDESHETQGRKTVREVSFTTPN
jgi:hypothetical protein